MDFREKAVRFGDFVVRLAALATMVLGIFLGSYALTAVAAGATLVGVAVLTLAFPFLFARRFASQVKRAGWKWALRDTAEFVGIILVLFGIAYVWDRIPTAGFMLIVAVSFGLLAATSVFEGIGDWWRSRRP